MTNSKLVTDEPTLKSMEKKWKHSTFSLAPDILSIWENPEDYWHLYTTAAPDKGTPYFLLDAEEFRPEWQVWVYPHMPEETRERLMLLLDVLSKAKPRQAGDLGTSFWASAAQPSRWMIESEEFKALGLTHSGNLEPTFKGSTGFEAIRRVLALPEGAGAEFWFLDVRSVNRILSHQRDRLIMTLGYRPAFAFDPPAPPKPKP